MADNPKKRQHTRTNPHTGEPIIVNAGHNPSSSGEADKRTVLTSERRDDLTRAALAGNDAELPADRALVEIERGLDALERSIMGETSDLTGGNPEYTVPHDPSLPNAWQGEDYKEGLARTEEFSARMEHIQQVMKNRIIQQENSAEAAANSPASAVSVVTTTQKRSAGQRLAAWFSKPSTPRQPTPRDLLDQKAATGKIDQSAYMHSQF